MRTSSKEAAAGGVVRSILLGAISALTAGLVIVFSTAPAWGDDAPKPLGGKILIAAFDNPPASAPADRLRALFLVDPDTEQHTLIGEPGDEAGTLSHDGRYLAAVNPWTKDPEKLGVWIVDLSGKTPRRRIFDRLARPLWSGDGKQLLLARSIDFTKFETYRIDFDGSGLSKLPVPETEYLSDWSSDGKWLATTNMRRNAKVVHILLMHPDGTASREIVSGEGVRGGACLSPAGGEIAYMILKIEKFSSTPSVWLGNIDGTKQRRLPIDFKEDVQVTPYWSPDGSHLALSLRWGARDKPKSDQIIIVDREGKEIRTIDFPQTWTTFCYDWK